MAKERNRLKDVVVKRLLGRKQPGMHPEGAGLYLRIRDGGGASWTFRYKLHGKDRWLDIGDPRDTSLARARVLAGAERSKVDEGRDPIAERRAADDLARKRGTFAELAEEWYAAEVEHRLKHPETVRRALDKYLLRIKATAAPRNTRRLKLSTPCASSGFCENCNSPQRIRRVWSIIERKPPHADITVLVCGEPLGL